MSIKHPRTRENVEIKALNVLWFVFVQYCDAKCAKNVMLLMKQEQGACSLLLRTSASRSSSTESADVCADVCLFVQMFVCAGVRRSGEWVKRSGCCASAEALGRINTLMMWSLHLHHHQLSGCLGQSLRSNQVQVSDLWWRFSACFSFRSGNDLWLEDGEKAHLLQTQTRGAPASLAPSEYQG